MSQQLVESARVPSRRTLAVLAAGIVPWVVLPYGNGGFSLVFSVVLADPGTVSVTSVYHYTFVYTRGTPYLAWPIAVALYAGGALNTALSRFDSEDRRITVGLFALAAVNVTSVAVEYSESHLGVVAIPLGAAPLALAAWTSRP